MKEKIDWKRKDYSVLVSLVIAVVIQIIWWVYVTTLYSEPMSAVTVKSDLFRYSKEMIFALLPFVVYLSILIFEMIRTNKKENPRGME